MRPTLLSPAVLLKCFVQGKKQRTIIFLFTLTFLTDHISIGNVQKGAGLSILMLMHTPTALSALVHSSDVLDTQWKSFSLTNTKSRDFVGWVWYHKSMKKPSHCCSKFGGSPHATAKIGHRTCHVLNVLKGKGVLFKHKDLSFRY